RRRLPRTPHPSCPFTRRTRDPICSRSARSSTRCWRALNGHGPRTSAGVLVRIPRSHPSSKKFCSPPSMPILTNATPPSSNGVLRWRRPSNGPGLDDGGSGTGSMSSRGDRRHYGRRHCELVILIPWRPHRLPDFEEVSVEVFDTQRQTRGIEYPLRVVPVDGPTSRLSRGGERLAVHDPVGDVLRTVILDSFANRGGKRLAIAKGDAERA